MNFPVRTMHSILFLTAISIFVCFASAGSTDNEFRVWRYDGILMPGWPVMSQVNMEGSPIVADFDGNPGLEAVIVDNGSPNYVYGYNLDGSVATDFPFSRPGYCGPNSPEVGDIDRDGDLEMALTMGSGHVGVWDFPVDYSEPTTGCVSLDVYDITGRCVAKLVDSELTSGSHSFGWSAFDLANGVYMVQLNTAAGTLFFVSGAYEVINKTQK